MKNREGLGRLFMGMAGTMQVHPPRMDPDAISLHGYTPANVGEFHVGRVPTAHCRPDITPDLDGWMNRRTIRERDRLRRI